MKYKIIWSGQSRRDYVEIMEYLSERYSAKYTLNLMDEIEHTIELISLNPKMFQRYGNEHTRRAVVNKHLSLFYTTRGDEVELLFFWNNRRNPDDLPI